MNVQQTIGDYFEDLLSRMFKLKRIDSNFSHKEPDLRGDTFCVESKASRFTNGGVIKGWQLEYLGTLPFDCLYAFPYHEIKTPISNDERQEIEYVLEYQDEFSSIGKDYYALDSEVIGIETYDYCKIHTTNHMWDTVRHGKICLQCNPFYKRKDKLDQINKVAE